MDSDSLQVFCQMGDPSSNEEIGKWLLDLATTIIGTGIGAGVTVWLFYEAIKNENRKERGRKLGLQKEKMQYFQALVIEIIKSLGMQIPYLDEFSQEVKSNPAELPLLKFVPLNDLDNIVHKIDREEYFHAYLDELKDEGANVEVFRKLMAYLNFFDASMSDIKAYLEKALNFDHERKIALRETLTQVIDETALLLKNKEITQGHTQIANMVNAALLRNAKSPEKNIEYYIQDFVRPLQQQFVRMEEPPEAIRTLMFRFKYVMTLASQIRDHNEVVAHYFAEQHKSLQEQFSNFTADTDRLRNHQVSKEVVDKKVGRFRHCLKSLRL